jgi:hypothetical protein
MWSRDHQIWNILGFIGIVLGVVTVAVSPDPEAYNLTPVIVRWLGLLSTVLTAALKFANSPAPGKDDAAKVDLTKTNIMLVFVVFVLGFTAYGCGAARQKPRHVATSAEAALKVAIKSFGAAEKQLYESATIKELTPAVHRNINKKLVEIDDAGIALTNVLLTWPEGQPAPKELVTIVDNVKSLVKEVTDLFPESGAKSKLLGYLSDAQGWLLAILVPSAVIA